MTPEDGHVKDVHYNDSNTISAKQIIEFINQKSDDEFDRFVHTQMAFGRQTSNCDAV